MPGGDRTGPLGTGPMTGRGLGYCAGLAGAFFGRRFGMGYGRGAGAGGRGRGWRHMFYATGLPGWMRFGWGDPAFLTDPPPGTEKRILEGEAEALKEQLDQIRKRLDELESGEKAGR